ncbi:MAG TPA: UPF0223 family protein [Sporosarcina sp.]|nr:UPF0223 family protein [Sporosarcina sp.]
MEYSYPIRTDWSTEEMIDVTTFFTLIEEAYEAGVSSEKVKQAYQQFKVIVPSKSEEKTLFREFEQSSTYKSYPIVKEALAATEDTKIIRK